MIVQQKEKHGYEKIEKIKNKNKKKRSNNEDLNNEPLNITLNTHNKKHKSSSSTYKDDTNDNHSYKYTHSLINDDNILKIASHNVQSFHNPVKQQQIINTLQINHIDIFGLSETNLSPKQIKYTSRSLSQSYDYFFSAGDRTLGSGVGIIIKKSISQHIFRHFDYKGRFIYIDMQMKNKTKLRIFQIYLHTSNYDIQQRVQTQKVLIEHIQQAINDNFKIFVMGDFNVNPDKPRHNETKYKRQFQIIQDLKNRCFFDIFDTIYDINPTTPHNTWFNTAGTLTSRIDLM
jgi:exonuclease III